MKQAQPSQRERTPSKQPFIEASDPWATHNPQPLSAREKLAQIQQEQRGRSPQPQPGSAREKLAGRSAQEIEHHDRQQQHTQEIER